MKIVLHSLCQNNRSNRDCLERHNISYECLDDKWLVFDICKEDARCRNVVSAVQSECLFQKAVYSKEEIDKANWFILKSKCGKVLSADDDYTFRYSCPCGDGEHRFHHESQIREYVVNKQIAWKPTNNFCSDVKDYYVIFCSSHAKKIITCNISGIEFQSVLQKNTMQPVTDLYQLRFTNGLPSEAIVLPNDTETIRCDQCGKLQVYVPNPDIFSIKIKLDYLSQEDAYITNDLFGEGFGYHLLIVSRKVYTIINEMRERNLTFIPVDVV